MSVLQLALVGDAAHRVGDVFTNVEEVFLISSQSCCLSRLMSPRISDVLELYCI